MSLSTVVSRLKMCLSVYRSAYLLYYFDVHQIMQKEIPNLPQSEINKRISKNWKRLSIAEKGYYLEKAKSEKEGTDTVSRILISLCSLITLINNTSEHPWRLSFCL